MSPQSPAYLVFWAFQMRAQNKGCIFPPDADRHTFIMETDFSKLHMPFYVRCTGSLPFLYLVIYTNKKGKC